MTASDTTAQAGAKVEIVDGEIRISSFTTGEACDPQSCALMAGALLGLANKFSIGDIEQRG